MTKQDAINYFKRSWAIGEDDDSRHHNEVLEFTIKALELEQEPCDDTVSREAVKELFQEGSVMGMYYFLGIDKLPSVTPARKEGKWTKLSNINPCVNCPICGKTFTFLLGGFCPNCGAKMEE